MKLNNLFHYKRPIHFFILTMICALTFSSQNIAYANSPERKYQGLLLNPEKTIKSYTMINQEGKEIPFPAASGKFQLLFFGYTNCPDVCPMTLHKIKQVIQDLDNNAKVEYYFISIDAERDKPGLLKSFVSYFHPKIKGITGSIHNIKGIEKEFGILTRKFQGKSALAYQLEHSVFMYLINKQGKLMLMYPGSSSTTQIVSDLNLLLGSG